MPKPIAEGHLPVIILNAFSVSINRKTGMGDQFLMKRLEKVVALLSFYFDKT